jgi:hypothetical protein
MVALVERMITPILVIGVVSAAFNLFPISGRLLTVLNRSFYIAVLAIGIYCVTKAVLILLNQWIESSEGRESFREPAQFVVRVVFGAFGTMIVLENLGISLTAVWTTLGVDYVLPWQYGRYTYRILHNYWQALIGSHAERKSILACSR